MRIGVGEKTRVLILTTDLYARIGGGESVYRRLVEDNPEIDFFYFKTSKNVIFEIPQNVTAIRLVSKPVLFKVCSRYDPKRKFSANDYLNNNQINAAELAEQYAKSAKNLDFDLIDIPEYEVVGDFLREALDRNRVRYKYLISFIHGALSITLDYEGNVSKKDKKEIEELEKLQRNDADRYLILDTWYPKLLGIELEKCLPLNPWLFISVEKSEDKVAQDIDSNGSTARLFFFSRWEKRKGVDFLPALASLINFDKVEVVLSGSYEGQDGLRKSVIDGFIDRNLSFMLIQSVNREEVFSLMRDDDVLTIPSHFDSFNLVALEGIAASKKVAISRSCGAFHFLKERHPNISFIEIDPKDLVSSALELNNALKKDQDVEAKTNSNTEVCKVIFSELNRREYTDHLLILLRDAEYFCYVKEQSHVFRDISIKRLSLTVLRIEYFRRFVAIIKNRLKKIYSKLFVNQRNISLVQVGVLILQSILRLNYLVSLLDRKKKFVFARPKHFLILSDIVTSSKIRRVTYALRSLRLSGFNVGFVNEMNLIKDMNELGLVEEARCLDLMLKPGSQDNVCDYLESRRLKLKSKPVFLFDVDSQLVSKKYATNPQITIIVSSYNASSKIETFLKRLSLCEELKCGSAEILLIDANSTTPDSQFAIKVANELGISLRAIRVNRRITIQEAWNFGVIHALGDYLTFLGVDETIYPNALRLLASELDVDVSVDWVMADSIVTEVDTDGHYLRDVMKYDRKDASTISPFLETCYVSYVAGMYRKDLHEKHGYYDPSFIGAGDTEFKSRVLPSLRVKYVPITLGEFLNYPDDRTTASEKVEIEDIRAWYIFRTPGGVKYQASIADTSFLESLGKGALGYRKSFCKHTSTDLEIASSVFQITNELNNKSSTALINDLEIAHNNLQVIRSLIGFPIAGVKKLRFRQFYTLLKWFDMNGRKSGLRGVNLMRHDNMFEQHIWYW